MRKFEKISFNEFKKSISNDIDLYNSYQLPVRKTIASAGYDFELIESIKIKPNEILVISSGIKIQMEKDEMLMLIVRSSIGFKYNVRLTNQVGIIESDYYNNVDNEGHIKFSLQNHGNETFEMEKGKCVVQGIITKFLVVDNEKPTTTKRIGGFGSTNNG